MATPPLLRLPVELRLDIYELVFAEVGILKIKPPNQHPLGKSSFDLTKGLEKLFPKASAQGIAAEHDKKTDDPVASGRHAMNLLQTSRLIRDEALPIFYSMVEFDLSKDFNARALFDWLKLIGPAAVANLEKMVLRCNSKCSSSPEMWCNRIARLDFGLQPARTAVRLRSV
jgi:hypothetical protein